MIALNDTFLGFFFHNEMNSAMHLKPWIYFQTQAGILD